MARQLLIETFPFITPQSRKRISESIQRTSDGRVLLTGRLQYANKRNGNERVYPRYLLEREVNKYIENRIRTGLSYGQCDHPDSDQISLQNVALLVRELHWEGDELIGTIELLNNRLGRDLKHIVVENKGSLSISSRGLGSLKRIDDNDVVQDDFELICWDLVVQPSTPGATFYTENKDLRSETKQYNIDQRVSELIDKKKKQKKYEQLNEIYNSLQNIINKYKE